VLSTFPEKMPYFYPKHLEDFGYVGKYSYALEFTTRDRAPLLQTGKSIALVVTQLRRAAHEDGFDVIHCVMPDHLHLVVDGRREDSDCKAFIKAAKQYSGYRYKREYGRSLWQRYGYERVIRSDMERALAIRYLLLANPVRAGIVADPRYFLGIGSTAYTVGELIQMSEYTSAYALE
jgi:REP element-mobilizing transposase RayT